MTDQPPHARANNTLNPDPFDLAHLREECLEALQGSPKDMEGLPPAYQAVVAAYRVMPLLAEILADGINQRYAAYQKKGSVGGRADMDLLIALFGADQAYGKTLTLDVRTPEGMALFEHPDFAAEIEELPAPFKEQVQGIQREWQQERAQRREALRPHRPQPEG